MQPRRPGRTSLRYIRDEGEVLRNSVASPSEDSTMSPLVSTGTTLVNLANDSVCWDGVLILMLLNLRIVLPGRVN